MSVGHADELWSPSKDVTRSPLGTTPLSGDSSDLPFGALRTSIDQSEIKSDCMLDTGQPFISGYKKLNEATLHATQDAQASLDTIEYFGGKSKLLAKEKVHRTKSWIFISSYFFPALTREPLQVSLACTFTPELIMDPSFSFSDSPSRLQQQVGEPKHAPHNLMMELLQQLLDSQAK